MNRAAPAAATFKEAIDLKLLTPVQRNLFTGEAEPVHVDIDHAIPEDETEVDDGISLVKTEDSARRLKAATARSAVLRGTNRVQAGARTAAAGSRRKPRRTHAPTASRAAH